MKGLDVKKKLIDSNFKLKDVAQLMGETPQNLNSLLLAEDIKTGILLRIASAIEKTPAFFFDNTFSEEELTNIDIKFGSNLELPNTNTPPSKQLSEMEMQKTIDQQNLLINYQQKEIEELRSKIDQLQQECNEGRDNSNRLKNT